MLEYYVYVIMDPRLKVEYIFNEFKFDYFPFYIGYGKNDRIKHHLYKRELSRKCYKTSKIKSILDSGLSPIFLKISENLTFEQANELEILFISLMGRIDIGTGILSNHTAGGMGTKDKVLSPESKDKMSKSHIGIKHSNETKCKLSNIHIGKTLSSETKNKISVSVSGDKNPFYGKKHNLDTFKLCKVVIQMDLEFNVINEFKSSLEAVRVTGIKNIYRVCNGTRLTAGGYRWIYKDK